MPAPTTPPSAPHALSSGAATEALLALGLKPVARELHDVDRVEEATARWRAMNYHTAVGEPVREDVDTAAMFVDVVQVHTTRHLATHPVIERVVALGGGPARRALLEPTSRLHRWLAERLDAERTPHQGPRPTGQHVRERCVVYVSKDLTLAERARTLDRMADDARDGDNAHALGELLGYPPCCVQAFCDLPRRWPNRYPIAAAAARTKVFEPRLNNVALDQFAWIAWFPCRYDCQASLAIADAAAEALSAKDAAQVEAADRALARPRLYLSDREQASLIGAAREKDEVTFTGLEAIGRSDAPPWDSVTDTRRLRVRQGEATFLRDGAPVTWDDSPLFLPFGLHD